MAGILLELGELAAEVAEIGEAGAELGAEGAEIGAGVGEAGAGAVVEGGAAAPEFDAVAAELAEQEGAAMAEGAGEFAEVEAGEAELAEAEAGAAEIEGAAPAGGRAANIWSNVKAFTKFVSVEVGKGALFYVGMKGAEKLIAEGKELFKGGDAASAQQKALVAVKKMAEVVKKLKAVTDDHYTWTKSHFNKAKSYGVLEIPGEHLKLLRYKLFVQKLAALDAQRNAIAKSLGAALKAKDVKKILSILPALKEYAAKAQELSQDIDAKEALMVNEVSNRMQARLRRL